MLFSNILLASVITCASADVIHLPLRSRDLTPSEAVHHLSARGIEHSTQIMGSTFYEADIFIGTPPQKISVCFDTGSPLLWVPGANSTQCQNNGCRSSFDNRVSSTWKYERETNNWGGVGNFGRDTVSYAGQTLPNFKTWVSKDRMANSYGIFGQSGEDDPASSFVKGLAAAGKISRAIYSLNSERAINWRDVPTQGTVNNVYYGGFDKKKYQGPLTTIQCDHHGGYAMPLGGLSIQGEKVKLAREHQIVLDTGGIALQVPNGTLKRISEKFGGGAVYETPGYWKVQCGSKPSLTYEFGYTKIEVDFTTYVRTSPHGGCRLEGVDPIPDGQQILLSGPALISRALVIYDNDRDTITIAQAKYSSESEVVEITDGIPGAVLYKDWVAGIPLSSSVAPVTKSVAPTTKSVAPVTKSVAVVTSSKPVSVAPTTKSVAVVTSKPVSSTLAVKTTSAKPTPTQAKPTPTPTPTQRQWCSFFGTFCIRW